MKKFNEFTVFLTTCLVIASFSHLTAASNEPSSKPNVLFIIVDDLNDYEGALSLVGNGLDKKDVNKQTYSYRTRNWRYILYMDGREELYDHKNDQYEWNNLANDKAYAPVKKDLQKQMKEIINK
ncbi:MAG: DUF4976 domain-containing protein [Bacteroidales bacterium]|nr:DUF4976 domain-containing protein [Bacteroidales bacterium]